MRNYFNILTTYMTSSSDSLNANIPYHFKFISTEVEPA